MRPPVTAWGTVWGHDYTPCTYANWCTVAMRRDPNYYNKCINTTPVTYRYGRLHAVLMSMFTGIIVDLDDSPPPDTTPGWATSAHTKGRHYYQYNVMSFARTQAQQLYATSSL